MLNHLRLARARGSLQAPNSQVQDSALQILDMVDEGRKEDLRVDMVKGLLALAGPAQQSEVARLFPEYVKDDPYQEAYTQSGEFDIDKVDDATVEWSVASKDQDEELSRWISEQERAGGVTFTAEDEGWK